VSAYKSSWKHGVAGLVFPTLERVGAGLPLTYRCRPVGRRR